MEDSIFELPKKPKADRYKVYLGDIDQSGYVNEKDQVGYAFQRAGSTAFRLKLWMFLNHQYFVIPTKEDQTKYNLYSLEEYISETKELKSFWNKVGFGELYGNYLKLKFNLLEKPMFLSLFEEKEASMIAQAMDAA